MPDTSLPTQPELDKYTLVAIIDQIKIKVEEYRTKKLLHSHNSNSMYEVPFLPGKYYSNADLQDQYAALEHFFGEFKTVLIAQVKMIED